MKKNYNCRFFKTFVIKYLDPDPNSDKKNVSKKCYFQKPVTNLQINSFEKIFQKKANEIKFSYFFTRV
jgi:hypothetical protein